MALSYLYATGSTERQKAQNQRNYAHKYYELVDGQVFRKADPLAKSQMPSRPAVTNTEIFSLVLKFHVDLGHAGYKKTYKAIQNGYYGIVRDDVSWLLMRCRTCMVNRVNRSRGVLEPIVSNFTLERVQIDLVDMRHEPDGQYKWLLHIRDHFSKYTSLYALKSKECVEVAVNIAQWIGCFGPPKILQCDNGKEFKGVLLVLLKHHGIKVINGRPRNPQTQGLVEQANGTFKNKLRAWKLDNKSTAWAQSLPEIALAMNLQTHSATGKTPYEVMFNRTARWPDKLEPWKRVQITTADIPDENIVTDEEGVIEEIDGWQPIYSFDNNLNNSGTLNYQILTTKDIYPYLDLFKANKTY